MAGEEEVLPVLGAVAGFSPEGGKKTVGCRQGGEEGASSVRVWEKPRGSPSPFRFLSSIFSVAMRTRTAVFIECHNREKEGGPLAVDCRKPPRPSGKMGSPNAGPWDGCPCERPPAVLY